MPFLRVFERIDTCREPEHFTAWFFRIVRNRAFNWLEGRRLRDVCADGAQVLEFSTFPPTSAGMRHALLAALAALDPRQREVVLLHRPRGLDPFRIATALEISDVVTPASLQGAAYDAHQAGYWPAHWRNVMDHKRIHSRPSIRAGMSCAGHDRLQASSKARLPNVAGGFPSGSTPRLGAPGAVYRCRPLPRGMDCG